MWGAVERDIGFGSRGKKMGERRLRVIRISEMGIERGRRREKEGAAALVLSAVERAFVREFKGWN